MVSSVCACVLPACVLDTTCRDRGITYSNASGAIAAFMFVFVSNFLFEFVFLAGVYVHTTSHFSHRNHTVMVLCVLVVAHLFFCDVVEWPSRRRLTMVTFIAPFALASSASTCFTPASTAGAAPTMPSLPPLVSAASPPTTTSRRVAKAWCPRTRRPCWRAAGLAQMPPHQQQQTRGKAPSFHPCPRCPPMLEVRQ